jgi:hypothetical protein
MKGSRRGSTDLFPRPVCTDEYQSVYDIPILLVPRTPTRTALPKSRASYPRCDAGSHDLREHAACKETKTLTIAIDWQAERSVSTVSNPDRVYTGVSAR